MKDGIANVSKFLAAVLVVLFVIGVVIEVGSFLALMILRGKGAVYDRGIVTQLYSDYLSKRDAVLGWAPDGTRSDPKFRSEAPPCVSIFGDSFTWSSGVGDADAWGSVLGSKLGCPVGNYGVAGYGTDQAYLRFLSLPAKGKFVFLNHLSENILRNVNQFRPLLYPGQEFAFKPRFVMAGGQLQLIPIPDIEAEKIQSFLRDPERYLDNEFFLPGGKAGVQKFAFPYSFSLAWVLADNFNIHAAIRGVPRHMQFYDPDHPSRALAVTSAILVAFAEAAAKRGQVGVVTIIPTCRDLRYLYTTGRSPYRELTARLFAQHIRFIDFAEEIALRTNRSEPEKLYDTCSGHFNKAGYRLLAEITADYLNNDDATKSRLGLNRSVAPAESGVGPSRR